MTSATNLLCPRCGGGLNLDLVAGEYVCLKCRTRFGMQEWVGRLKVGDARKWEREKSGAEEPMAKKGTCAVCGRGGVAIVAKECCGSCYVILNSVAGGDVEKAKEYRKMHPVHPHTEAKAAPAGKRARNPKKEKAPGNKEAVRPAAARDAGGVEEIVQKKRVVLDLDMELRINSFKVTLGE